MSSLGIGGVVFVCIFAGAMLGMFLHNRLPADHLSAESRDVMKLGTGLIATMTALVLGLLTASAKGSFDAQKSEVQQSATNVVLLDRTLAQYGPEAAPIRAAVLVAVQRRIESIWPAGSAPIKIDDPQAVAGVERISAFLRALADEDAPAGWTGALQLCDQLTPDALGAGRPGGRDPPGPLLVVVVCWLTVIFAGFGISPAQPDRRRGSPLRRCPCPGDLSHPRDGSTAAKLLKIPSDSRYALAHLGQ
jgi:hypothetical protein